MEENRKKILENEDSQEKPEFDLTTIEYYE
jgi:hypothetical protein